MDIDYQDIYNRLCANWGKLRRGEISKETYEVRRKDILDEVILPGLWNEYSEWCRNNGIPE